MSQHFGLLCGLDVEPFVGCCGAAHLPIGQPELVRPAPLRVAGASPFCDLNKSKGLDLTDRWGDGVPVDAVLDELVVGDG